MKQVTNILEVPLGNSETIRAGGDTTLRIPKLHEGIGLVALFGSGTEQQLTLWHLQPTNHRYTDGLTIESVNGHIRSQLLAGRTLHAAAFIRDSSNRQTKATAEDWQHAIDIGTGENRGPITIIAPPYDVASGMRHNLDVQVGFVADSQSGFRYDVSLTHHFDLLPVIPYSWRAHI